MARRALELCVVVLALAVRGIPAYYDAVVVDADAESRGEPDYDFDFEDCQLPKSSGPCRGFFSNYYFNKNTYKCEKFIWSGCGGNENRFESKSACESRCKVARQSVSDNTPADCARVDPSTCDVTKKCRMSRDAAGCPICDCLQKAETCNLPAMRGHCRALLPRWRYDAKSGRCRLFHFGGCDGNGNNFQSEKHCLALCKGVTPAEKNIDPPSDD